MKREDRPEDGDIRGFFDAEANRYGREDSGAGLLQTRIRAAAAAALEGVPGPVFEVGCGNGMLLELLSPSADAGLYGADFSDRMLAGVRGRLGRPPPLVQARAQELPVRDASLGAVACVNTIYNLPDAASLAIVLREFLRVLRRGGLVVFEIRNRRDPLTRFLFHRGRSAQHPLWMHDPAETRELLGGLGFQVERAVPVLIPWERLAPAVLFAARRT
ncbi:MAG: class I SAM-dependent methyltransferase [Candidatus Wallbacteria bacterium]|nr:class I SAM-dependent methyltransferase [Candidatus Wallbacteria bacterium]